MVHALMSPRPTSSATAFSENEDRVLTVSQATPGLTHSSTTFSWPKQSQASSDSRDGKTTPPALSEKGYRGILQKEKVKNSRHFFAIKVARLLTRYVTFSKSSSLGLISSSIK